MQHLTGLSGSETMVHLQMHQALTSLPLKPELPAELPPQKLDTTLLKRKTMSHAYKQLWQSAQWLLSSFQPFFYFVSRRCLLLIG